jgi:hypothetical protein
MVLWASASAAALVVQTLQPLPVIVPETSAVAANQKNNPS